MQKGINNMKQLLKETGCTINELESLLIYLTGMGAPVEILQEVKKKLSREKKKCS